MPRHAGCPNITNYHYRADIYDTENGNIFLGSKYYFTRKEMCEEWSISPSSMYNMMKKKDFVPEGYDNLKGVKFFRETIPAIKVRYEPNNNVYGVLDEL